jgi:hypothetical protein
MDSKSANRETNNSSHFGCLAFVPLLVSYAVGIWLGLWNTYDDIAPSWERVEFALIITAIPFLIPLMMNVISIALLRVPSRKPWGLLLLCGSVLSALVVGLIVVPMGNF